MKWITERPDRREKSPNRKIREYKKQARKGSMQHQQMLGLLYETGYDEIKRDFAESSKWYRMAAEQGDDKSQYRLAIHYAYGLGVEKDDSEALRWFNAAVESGCHHMRYRIGLMFLEGEGVDKDIEQAVKWFKESALRGDSSSAMWLSEAYRAGEFVVKDEKEAARWDKINVILPDGLPPEHVSDEERLRRIFG